jgi:hypothetical protein
MKASFLKVLVSCEGQNEGTNRGTLKRPCLYPADSKEALGIIYAAVVLLESVI